MASLDYLISGYLNQFVGHSSFVDHALKSIASAFSVSSIPLLACVWYFWFRRGPNQEQTRELLLRDFIAILLVGPVSRILQLVLPFHARPFFTPGAHIHLADPEIAAGLGHWNSLPSDHAALYGALAFIVTLHSRALAVPAWLIVLITSLARISLGIHWTSDVLAGVLLGIACVWIVRRLIGPTVPRYLMLQAEAKPALFFACAFFISYQVGTLFTDVRHLGTGVQVAVQHFR